MHLKHGSVVDGNPLLTVDCECTCCLMFSFESHLDLQLIMRVVFQLGCARVDQVQVMFEKKLETVLNARTLER